MYVCGQQLVRYKDYEMVEDENKLSLSLSERDCRLFSFLIPHHSRYITVDTAQQFWLEEQRKRSL